MRAAQTRFAGVDGEPEEFSWRKQPDKNRPPNPTPTPAHKKASQEHWLFKHIPWLPVTIPPIIPHPNMDVANLPTNLETRSAMWRHNLEIPELQHLQADLKLLGYEPNGSVDAIGAYDFIQAGLQIRQPWFLPPALKHQRHTVRKLTAMIQDLFRNPTRFYVKDNEATKARINSITLDKDHYTILIGNEANIEVDQQARSIRSRYRKGDEWKAAGDLEHLPEPINLDVSGSVFDKPRVSLLIQRTPEGNLLLVNQSPTNEPLVTMSDGIPLKLATNSVPISANAKAQLQGLTHSLILQHPNQIWRTNVMAPPVSALVEPKPSIMNPLYISVQPQRGIDNNGVETDEAEWVITVSPNKPGERRKKLKGEK